MADIAFDALLSVEADRPAAMRPRHVAAGVIGNALEFYDFLIFSYFAVYIGQAFFPGAGHGNRPSPCSQSGHMETEAK